MLGFTQTLLTLSVGVFALGHEEAKPVHVAVDAKGRAVKTMPAAGAHAPAQDGSHPARGICKLSDIAASSPTDARPVVVDAAGVRASSDAFERLVRSVQRPVLIQGTTKPSSLRELCLVEGAQHITVSHRKAYNQSDWKLKRWHEERLHWNGICRHLLGSELDGSLQLDSLEQDAALKSLLQSHDNTPYLRMDALPFQSFFGEQPLYRGQNDAQQSMWVGAAGSQTALHIDPFDNIAMQLTGTKRWHIFPPGDYQSLAYEGFKDSWDLAGNVCERKHDWDTTFSNYTMINGAPTPPGTQYYNVDVHAGDTLYLPQYWGHFVENVGASVMANFWLKDSWSCCGDASKWVTVKTVDRLDSEIHHHHHHPNKLVRRQETNDNYRQLETSMP